MTAVTPDTTLTFLSNMDLFWLIVALGGGAFGAMIGANTAFAFTGVSILLGLGVLAATGDSTILDFVSFGPVFGPHIAFAGGVAAAAYAASKKLLPDGADGKDVNTPLAGLGRPDVLLVGALFGAGGYVVQRLIALIPWFGTHTDTVALTVFLSGIVTRLVFGKLPVMHGLTKPDEKAYWLRWQEKPGQLLTISVFASLFAAAISMMVASYVLPIDPANTGYGLVLDNVHVLPFAISALCIFFVAMGYKFPVTHHMTITAALAGVCFYNISGSGLVGLLVGTLFGVVAAFVGELVARLFYNHGDTHIDPPAGTIWIMNTLIAVSALPFQG